MCDESTLEDELAAAGKTSNIQEGLQQNLTRRRFGLTTGTLTVSGALAAWLPGSAQAEDLVEQEVTIKTPDGEADAFFVHPAKGEGASAAVLVWPDVLGLRDAYRLVGRRLAASGYAALVVNPYYRSQKAPVVEPGASFRDDAVRSRIMPLARSLSPETNVIDAKAFVSWLDDQEAVDTKRKVGTIGYCMGGAITMRAAAAIPKRIGAGGSFHGGRLVTDDPGSPHLLVPKMSASFLIAIAGNDDERDPEAKKALAHAFAMAKLDAEIDVYKGTLHGWCTPDSQVYNEEQAEKAWARMMDRFETALA